MADAARRLASGGLVAFPTETVYGLGANALNEASVREIFAVKGRPLSDPLIVHCATAEDAAALVVLDADERDQSAGDGSGEKERERSGGSSAGLESRAFHALAGAFWPGGLTLVATARPHLPACLSAGTGKVGVRVPAHPLARRLIRSSGVPVAAPSANRFGHVSPTTAQHVLEDLGHAPIAVLDGDRRGGGGGTGTGTGTVVAVAEKQKETDEDEDDEDDADDVAFASAAATCEHGIESTVCKVDAAAGELVLFRRGATSERSSRRRWPLRASRASCASEWCRARAHAAPGRRWRQRAEAAASEWEGPGGGEQQREEGDDDDLAPPKFGGGLLCRQVTDPTWAMGGGEEEEAEAAVAGRGGARAARDALRARRADLRAARRGSSCVSKSRSSSENGAVEKGSPPGGAGELKGGTNGRGGDDGKDGGDRLRGSLEWLSGAALAYRDLSAARDAKEAARGLFAALRWAEARRRKRRPRRRPRRTCRVVVVVVIVVVVIVVIVVGAATARTSHARVRREHRRRGAEDEHAASVADRVFRAASGRVVAVAPGALPPADVLPLVATPPGPLSGPLSLS